MYINKSNYFMCNLKIELKIYFKLLNSVFEISKVEYFELDKAGIEFINVMLENIEFVMI